MLRIAIAIFAATLAMAPAGCARVAPILNIESAPLATVDGKGYSENQVRAAIVSAGTSLGWRITEVGPGHLEGMLNLRAHTAVVDIPYGTSGYGIKFKRAENLNLGETTIHSNYNYWVLNLDRAIRTELSRM